MNLNGFAGDKLNATFQGQNYVELPVNLLSRIDSLNASLAYLSDWGTERRRSTASRRRRAHRLRLAQRSFGNELTPHSKSVGMRTYERGIRHAQRQLADLSICAANTSSSSPKPASTLPRLRNRAVSGKFCWMEKKPRKVQRPTAPRAAC